MPEKSIAQKMLIKKGNKVLILNPPEGYLSILGDLPEGVEIFSKPAGKMDVVQVFVKSKEGVDKIFEEARNWLEPKSVFWVAYPKGTSGVKTDINRDIIWEIAKKRGFSGVAMISLDEIWSGFRCKEV
jgi:predicted CoA-binding protein